MKKLFLAFIAVCALALTGCNYQLVDLNYNFTKVHIMDRGCFEISSWKDYEDGDQIQVNIVGYGTCLFHANQIVLVENKCPICGR